MRRAVCLAAAVVAAVGLVLLGVPLLWLPAPWVDPDRVLARMRGTVQESDAWPGFPVVRTRAGTVASRGGLPGLTKRSALGAYLAAQGYTRGAEVGVQRGLYSQELLTAWSGHGLDLHVLVDVWAPQANYSAVSNVPLSAQLQLLREAQERMAPYAAYTLFLRMPSLEAARWFAPASLDVVYLDARHDYCAVLDDLRAYWPLVRPGGLVAGHDYITADQFRKAPNSNISLCADGTVRPEAVKGAVRDFVREVGLVPDRDIGITQESFPTYFIRKPA
jgi:hypothetical protein